MSTHYPDDDDSRAARRDQWGLIRRWRWIAGGLVVGIVLAGAYSQTRPVHYTATTQVAVRQVVTDPFNSNGTNLTVAISMPTEKEIASSQGVADVAKATLKSSQSTRSLLNHLSVSIPNGTQILSFAYQSDSPDLAVKGAQAFANAYLKSRQAQIQATVTNIASTLAKQIKTLQAQSSSLASKIAVADTAEKAALGSQRSGVDIQLAGAETSASALASLDTTPGYITSQATRPQNPTGVTTKILVILGALLGLIAGIIVAQIRAGSDGRVFDAEEVAEILGVPLLNRAPLKLSALWRYTDSPGRNSSRTVEQLREIALRMIDGTSALSRRNVLIVSGSRREGRTIVTAHLARMLTLLGRNVIAVSADLVNPNLHRVMDVPPTPGVAELLSDFSKTTLKNATVTPAKSTFAAVAVVPSGNPSRARAELMQHMDVWTDMLDAWRDDADVVVVDTPALFDYADVLALARREDVAVVVVALGRHRPADLRQLRASLDGRGIGVGGLVVVKARRTVRSLLGVGVDTPYGIDSLRSGFARRQPSALAPMDVGSSQ
jgi:succinoglycan biosynthesis transport protein ExoP